MADLESGIIYSLGPCWCAQETLFYTSDTPSVQQWIINILQINFIIKHHIWKLTECKSNVSVKFYTFAITILKLVLHIKFYTFTAKYIFMYLSSSQN